jgi:hypothetical protein
VDRASFAEMNTHPLVVESLGSSPSRAESDELVDRHVLYRAGASQRDARVSP